MGRWGFIDHMFYEMGGRPADRARMENAWLVDYKRTPVPWAKCWPTGWN